MSEMEFYRVVASVGAAARLLEISEELTGVRYDL
jgi:hypothetical protein